VDGAELSQRLRNARLCRRLIGNVNLRENRIAVQASRKRFTFGCIEIEDHRLAATFDDALDSALAETGCATRNDGDFVVDVQIALREK
jgi:hypothetical protein